MAVFYTPRFSYVEVKTACTSSVGWCTSACAYPSRHGWVRPGRVCRVGIRRAIPGTTQPAREVPNEECQPRSSLLRAGRGYWGPSPGHMVFGGRGRSCTHPAGPVGLQSPPWYRTSQIPASGPIKARFQLYFYKVSQNHGVSPKSMQKAYHSPYFQNGHQKSALGFLGFPF